MPDNTQIYRVDFYIYCIQSRVRLILNLVSMISGNLIYMHKTRKQQQELKIYQTFVFKKLNNYMKKSVCHFE